VPLSKLYNEKKMKTRNNAQHTSQPNCNGKMSGWIMIQIWNRQVTEVRRLQTGLEWIRKTSNGMLLHPHCLILSFDNTAKFL